MTVTTERIELPVADGTALPAYRADPGAGRVGASVGARTVARTGVIVAHELFGVNPGIERTAMIGFSAGGHLAYLAACQRPISRTAVIYGGWLPTTDIPLSQPEPTLDLTPGITGRILYVVGENDTLIDAGQRAQIGAALARAGIDHEVVVCPGAGHAFFWPGTAAFSPAATEDTWARILGLLAV